MGIAPRFPSLRADAALADVQVRQTLAMGLVPVGICLLLAAAVAPDWPSTGLWVGGGAAIGGMALIWGLWKKSEGRDMRGYSTVHFLVRYLFVGLCPALMWLVFGGVILDLAGLFPPLMLALLLLLYPAGRILHEMDAEGAGPSPRWQRARILCGLAQMISAVLALAGILSGAVVEAHRDYPTDPTPALLVIWILALLALVVGVALAVSRWPSGLGRAETHQPLDDEPAQGPRAPSRFGSDRY